MSSSTAPCRGWSRRRHDRACLRHAAVEGGSARGRGAADRGRACARGAAGRAGRGRPGRPYRCRSVGVHCPRWRRRALPGLRCGGGEAAAQPAGRWVMAKRCSGGGEVRVDPTQNHRVLPRLQRSRSARRRPRSRGLSGSCLRSPQPLTCSCPLRVSRIVSAPQPPGHCGESSPHLAWRPSFTRRPAGAGPGRCCCSPRRPPRGSAVDTTPLRPAWQW